uniref:von Willebrand factor-like n=1 Tax=Saccoglossus kowalevskii TaxID=10224 RepID=A0ABM0N0P5_SACKO
VVANNQKIKPSDSVSYTREVYVIVEDVEYELLQGNNVRVNGSSVNLPYNDFKVEVKNSGRYVKLLTDFGLVVLWDTSESVVVYVSHTYWNRTCGLCGTLDGNEANDFTTDQGIVVDDISVFADHWKTNGDECTDLPTTTYPCDGLDSTVIERYKAQCKILFNET